ncbi:MAG: ATP-binding protein [Planctomycetaceae bacterium]|jgi:AAA15 family ATPase/GTPase|nr:ATP-binding protein [Planctomycetaceae bacterium]
MLIEFSIGNFRSFGEIQKFSLVASNYEKNLPDNKIKCSLPGMSGLDYLSAAAVYGANASGKSNLLLAFNVLCNFVENSFRADLKFPTCAAPFKLNKSFQKLPTTFEILFVINNVRYKYNLALTPEQVINESLTAYPKGRPQDWYHRKWNEKNQEYDWSFPNYPVKKGLPQIAERTRSNVAFLSKSADDKHSQLTNVYNWFTQKVKRLNFAGGRLIPVYTMEAMKKSQIQHEKVISLLQNADFDIISGQVNEKELSDDDIQNLPPPLLAMFCQTQTKNNKSSFKSLSLSFVHRGNENSVEMDFEAEESEGTKRYFALLGPWLDVLENGDILFVDELETCLHPLLLVELIKLFRSPNNRNGAQLIFTTHNPLLLDETILRHDQIWFTEKQQNGETNLYPLTEFAPRKGEALVKGYLAGRYGGIPFIPNGLVINKDNE